MTLGTVRKRVVVLAAVLSALAAGRALGAEEAAAAPRPLLDMANADAAARLKPSSDQVTVAPAPDPAAPGLAVTIVPGAENYPGVRLEPQEGPWDLSGYGHVEARIVNMGEQRLAVTLRVDNAGDWQKSPWNAEPIYLEPGASGTVRTIFGFSYGHKPGSALDPSAVVGVLVFAGRSDSVQAFRIESLSAAGPAGEKPPVDPRSVRVRPEDGVLLGPDTAIDAAAQVAAEGVQAEVAAGGAPPLRITFRGAPGAQVVRFKPGVGRWDLRDYLQVTVSMRNDGQAPVTPRLRLESDRAPTAWVIAEEPLAPGAAGEVTVPFAAAVPWVGERTDADPPSWRGRPGTGTEFGHDAVGAVVISAERPQAGGVLVVDAVRAALPAGPELPNWLGRRPPVEGDWVITLSDDFDGTALDLTKWNNTGPNYWDGRSHWSKDNLIVGDGAARLRYERRTGRHNDEPDGKESDYQGGYLDTYGKWMQTYGYFEARMKLPTAPGLWPAFWMMPDRGEESGEQWVRQSTGNGGMEFDIMEHLTRWGPYRYNLAVHWDGYGDGHKSIGTSALYVQPDEGGFITAGLLWLPGLAVWYANGHEVARWEDPRVCSVQCDLMFTLPMGGWDNSALDDARLPDEFVIDYVRVWQRRDLMQP